MSPINSHRAVHAVALDSLLGHGPGTGPSGSLQSRSQGTAWQEQVGDARDGHEHHLLKAKALGSSAAFLADFSTQAFLCSHAQWTVCPQAGTLTCSRPPGPGGRGDCADAGSMQHGLFNTTSPSLEPRPGPSTASHLPVTLRELSANARGPHEAAGPRSPRTQGAGLALTASREEAHCLSWRQDETWRNLTLQHSLAEAAETERWEEISQGKTEMAWRGTIGGL